MAVLLAGPVIFEALAATITEFAVVGLGTASFAAGAVKLAGAAQGLAATFAALTASAPAAAPVAAAAGTAAGVATLPALAAAAGVTAVVEVGYRLVS